MARWPASRRRATSATAGARSQPSKWRPRAPRQAAARRPGPDCPVFRAFPCPATRRLHVLRCLRAAALRRSQGAKARRYADGRRATLPRVPTSCQGLPGKTQSHELRGTRRQSARPSMTAARTPIHELAECSIPSGCGAGIPMAVHVSASRLCEGQGSPPAAQLARRATWPCMRMRHLGAPRIPRPWAARHTAPVSASDDAQSVAMGD